MTSATLFEKLQEHELEHGRFEQHEESEKRHKGISLKVDSNMNQQEGSLQENDNIPLMVKKFSKFLKKNKTVKFGQSKIFVKKNKTSTPNQNFNCFGCGKQRTSRANIFISPKEK